MEVRSELLRGRVLQHHLDWLMARGITGQDLVDVGGIGVASVRFLEDSAFEFADDGVEASILPAYEHGELIDLVAFVIDRPEHFSRLYRRAFSLGIDKALDPNRFDDGVRVFQTPLAWLQHGGRGLVILDPSIAWGQLSTVGALVAEDEAHADELYRMMQPPPWRGRILFSLRQAA